MSKWNENIKLWMAGGEGVKPLSFYAFSKQTEEKAVERFINVFILKNKYNYPKAIIFVGGEAKYHFIQGVKTENPKINHWFGPSISVFKMKLILVNNDFTGPFYSNSLIIDRSQQFHSFVDEYCFKYQSKIAYMQIYDISGIDKLIATATFKDDKMKLKII